MKISESLIKRLKNEVPNRDYLQELAVQLSNDYEHIWLKWITSVGKTRAAGLIGHSKKVLCTCQRILHIENWKEDLDKFNIDYSNWEFICYNSIKKYENNTYDLLICDEADCISDRVVESLKLIERSKTVLLTADATDEKKNLLKPLYNYVWEITLKQSQKWNLLPIATIYCVKVKLDNKNKYVEYERFKKKNLYTEEQCLVEIEKDITYWRESFMTKGDNWSKVMMLRKGLERKQLFDKAKRRVSYELWVANKERSVVFVDSIEEASRYENAVHSKNTDKVNQELIESFNRGDLDTLCNVQCLVRGLNLKDSKVGIFQTFNANGIALLQSQGRLYRSLSPIMYIPVVMGTKNEKDLQRFILKQNIKVEWI